MRGMTSRTKLGLGSSLSGLGGLGMALGPVLGASTLPRPWSFLVGFVVEVDPLRCVCGSTMRVVSFILNPAVIGKILQHRPRAEPRAHAPPPG